MELEAGELTRSNFEGEVEGFGGGGREKGKDLKVG